MPIDSRRSSISIDRQGRLKLIGRFELPSQGSLVERVTTFLVDNYLVLGISKDLDNLKFIDLEIGHIGAILRYVQTIYNEPIEGATILVHVWEKETVLEVSRAMKLPKNVEQASIPEVDPLEAIRKELKSNSKDLPELITISVPEPKRCYLNWQGSLIPVFIIILPIKKPRHDLKIIVHRNSGKIIDEVELGQGLQRLSALLFRPNPIVMKRDECIRRSSNVEQGCTPVDKANLNGMRKPCNLIEVDDTTTYRLEGANVQVLGNSRQVSTYRKPEGGMIDFDVETLAFEEHMVYYYIDAFQRYLQSIGIQEFLYQPANTRIDWSDDVTQYSPGEGFSGMIIFGSPHPGDNYPAEDGEMILHEYSHFLIDKLTYGDDIVRQTHFLALSEGFSLLMPCLFCAGRCHPDRQGNSEEYHPDVFADWACPGFLNPRGEQRYAIRITDDSYPKYDEFDEGVANGKDRTDNTYYKIGAYNYSRALWNIFLDLGGRSKKNEKRASSRDKIIRLIFFSSKKLDKSATIESACMNILKIDSEIDEYRGRDIFLMLDSFQKERIIVCNPVSNILIKDCSFIPEWYVNDGEGNDDYGGSLWFENRSEGLFLCAKIANEGKENVRAMIFTLRMKMVGEEEIRFENTRSVPEFDFGVGATRIVMVRIAAHSRSELSGARVFLKIRAPFADKMYKWDFDLLVP